MVKDAEAFAAEDQAGEAAEARNGADQLVYTVDKSLGDEAKSPSRPRRLTTSPRRSRKR